MFRTRLRMLVEAQLDMVNTNDWEDLLETELIDEDIVSTEA